MPKERKYLAAKPGKDELLIKREAKGGGVATLEKALKGMKPGEERTGFLGKGNTVRLPDYVVPRESLSAEETIRRRLLQVLLSKWIIPNSLSMKSSPELDKRSLVGKLTKSSLKDLERLIPASLQGYSNEALQRLDSGQNEISEQEKAEIQELYKEVSP